MVLSQSTVVHQLAVLAAGLLACSAALAQQPMERVAQWISAHLQAAAAARAVVRRSRRARALVAQAAM